MPGESRTFEQKLTERLAATEHRSEKQLLDFNQRLGGTDSILYTACKAICELHRAQGSGDRPHCESLVRQMGHLRAIVSGEEQAEAELRMICERQRQEILWLRGVMVNLRKLIEGCLRDLDVTIVVNSTDTQRWNASELATDLETLLKWKFSDLDLDRWLAELGQQPGTERV